MLQSLIQGAPCERRRNHSTREWKQFSSLGKCHATIDHQIRLGLLQVSEHGRGAALNPSPSATQAKAKALRTVPYSTDKTYSSVYDTCRLVSLEGSSLNAPLDLQLMQVGSGIGWLLLKCETNFSIQSEEIKHCLRTQIAASTIQS